MEKLKGGLYQQHPVFKPAPADGRVWRYLDLAKLVSLISRRALYFPLASTLDDPYEGVLPRLLETMLPRDVIPVFKTSPVTSFVSCWHLNSLESAAMWQIYSKFNEGVAIQSTFSRLTASFTGFAQVPKGLSRPTAIHAGMVYYIDYDREVFQDKHRWLNGLAPLMHKRRSFAYESEVRAVCTIANNVPSRNELTPKCRGIHVDCDLGQLVEAVYVAPLAPTFFRECVEAVVRQFDLNVRVIQSDLMSRPLY
jgi:hypothetical protein